MIACSGECVEGFDFDIVMAFQPVVDVAAKRIYGYEALVRGRNGEGAGQVLARVTDDNRYEFDQQCRVTAIATAAELGLDRRLSINFLPNAVYHPEACLKLTLDAAARHKFPASLITFEFTENEQIIDRIKLQSIIETYRRHGFMTALDDFGAGYAGLSLLAEFQPEVIKIDRLLISGIDVLRPKRIIVAAMLAMAKELGLAVVAEGVETREEATTLADMGVHLFQGFYFARPVIGKLAADHEIGWI
jgi:EAL domain-containing protein (putative c-di-GMP-specific phosphodiesterase class I)